MCRPSPAHEQTTTRLFQIPNPRCGLPEPFITGNSKEMECLNLDTYDVQVFRNRVKALVVQARSFWKNKRKGYTRSQKRCFLVTKSGRKVEVTELDNSICAKRAKNTNILGELVGHYTGRNVVTCKAPLVATALAYKVLAKTADGRLVSAYDNSEYELGVWRSETARPDHNGGFYFYRNDALAIDGTERGLTFARSVAAGKELVLCTAEVARRMIAYTGGKCAASRLRVLSVERPVELDADA